MQQFQKMTKVTGILFIVAAAVLWSSGGILIKAVEWPPLAIAGMRSAIAAIVIRICFSGTSLSWSRAQIGAAVAYAATVMLFVSATKLTTAANAVLLQFSSPIFVAILGAVILKEKPKAADWATIGLVTAGMILFFQDQVSPGGLFGNVLAICSGVSIAFMAVLMRKQKDGAPFGSVLLGNILAFFCCLPFIVTAPALSTKGWVVLVLLGCFQLGLPYMLYSVAIKHVSALEATLITVIEPILNPIWVLLFLGEEPGHWALVGGAVILTSITVRYVGPLLRPQPAAGAASASLRKNSSGEGSTSATHQGE